MMERARARVSRAMAPAATGLVIAALAAGCTANRHHDGDLSMLLATYREENDRIAASRQAARESGIRMLAVDTAPGRLAGERGAVVVSADLVAARLDVVVERILEASETSFVSEVSRLGGTVTARFDQRPVLEALQILLSPRGMTATLDRGVIRLHEGPPVDRLAAAGDEGDREEETVSLEVPLAHVTTDRAAAILDQLYPEDEDSGIRQVMFAPRAEVNSVFLSGPRAKVRDAERLLGEMDTDPGHVLFEALVVEFHVGSFLDLSSRIQDGMKGHVSNFFFDIANLVGDTISFSRVADAATSTTFSAVLNMLIQKEEARVVSRPYVATVSGSPAHLEVAEDRFVVVESPGDIDVTLESISSGVTIDLLPVVTAEGAIQLELSLDESRFVPTLENVEQRRARNTVSTFARVEAGETVIIGGLMLKTRANSVAGIPVLRRIFPLSLLFGHEDYSRQESQVMIFITPHRWEPGMDTPLVAQETFHVDSHADQKVGRDHGFDGEE